MYTTCTSNGNSTNTCKTFCKIMLSKKQSSPSPNSITELKILELSVLSVSRYYNWKKSHQSKQNSIHHWLTRSWKPSFKIKFLRCSMVKCTRHNVDNAIRNTQCLIVRLGIGNHLVHHFPWFAVIWWCQTELLYLNISSSTLTLSERQYPNYRVVHKMSCYWLCT